jgi:hypothetical protein
MESMGMSAIVEKPVVSVLQRVRPLPGRLRKQKCLLLAAIKTQKWLASEREKSDEAVPL